MRKQELLIGSSGIIAVVVTRKVIQNIGINNIDLQARIFILYALTVVYVIKSIRERNKAVRKYSIILSIMFFIFDIFLSAAMIIKEAFPEYHKIIKVPMGIFIILIFACMLIPAYGIYFARKG